LAFFNGRVVNERAPRVRQVWNLNPRPDKFYTALQTFCHRFNLYCTPEAVFPGAMMRRRAWLILHTIQRQRVCWFWCGNLLSIY